MVGIAIQSVFEIDAVDNVVKNNIIHTAGTYLVYHFRNQNTVFDNNLYYPDGPAAFALRIGEDIHTSDFATWQVDFGQDTD